MEPPASPGSRIAIVRAASWCLVLIAVLALLILGAGFLIPLTIAILLWGLLSALTEYIGRLSLLGRSLPAWAARTVSIALVFGANLLIYDLLARQAPYLEAAAPVYQENFARIGANIAGIFGLDTVPTTGMLLDFVDLNSLLGWLGSSVGAGITNLLLILIYVGFLLAEEKQLPAKLARLRPDPADAEKLRTVATDISSQVQRYLWIKTLVSLLTGFVSYVILRLIGVDFAAVWALMIFLLNFIPNIGSMLGVVLPALLTLVQFDTYAPFVMVVIGLGATQFVIGNFIEPVFLGRTLNLSSFMIVLSLTLWGMIWGIPGMFLSVPIMVVIAIVCSHIDQLRWVAVLLSKDGQLMTLQSESATQ